MSFVFSVNTDDTDLSDLNKVNGVSPAGHSKNDLQKSFGSVRRGSPQAQARARQTALAAYERNTRTGLANINAARHGRTGGPDPDAAPRRKKAYRAAQIAMEAQWDAVQARKEMRTAQSAAALAELQARQKAQEAALARKQAQAAQRNAAPALAGDARDSSLSMFDVLS